MKGIRGSVWGGDRGLYFLKFYIVVVVLCFYSGVLYEQCYINKDWFDLNIENPNLLAEKNPCRKVICTTYFFFTFMKEQHIDKAEALNIIL